MTPARLLSINSQVQAASEEGSLRDQMNDILDERQESLKIAVTRWLIYAASFGARSVQLDECPVALSKSDREFVLDWLDDEGFAVRSPRYVGRASIQLEPRKK